MTVSNFAADPNYMNLIDADPANIGGADPDYFQIEYYYNAQPPPGTWNLSQAPDDNYGTCEHCVRLFKDYDGMNFAKQFFQASGTMSVTTAGAQDNECIGSMTTVTLIEVTIDPNTFESTPVPGGECYTIQMANWDTTP